MHKAETKLGQGFKVALDGPCGSGKSTLGKKLAAQLGFVYIDTGAMYRATALAAHHRGISMDDEPALAALAKTLVMEFRGSGDNQRLFLNGEDVSEAIRDPLVSQLSSRVSAVAGVRRVMVQLQRRMSRCVGVVMDGRDIGTVVFPDAEIKIYLDASIDERAQRRYVQDMEAGRPSDLVKTKAEILERDYRDMNRKDSPLRRAPDAVYLDTTAMTIDDVLAAMLEIVNRAAEGSSCSRD